jgi:hypothetical protein
MYRRGDLVITIQALEKLEVEHTEHLGNFMKVAAKVYQEVRHP